ncbi:MAG: hypothetical protein A2096_00605 [Spirochaetes bacterium GWF1_41_5]|nr:MAG: hypothetical protein A2096_00605 [Spirochaetes bacterium GWF1_41_5]
MKVDKKIILDYAKNLIQTNKPENKNNISLEQNELTFKNSAAEKIKDITKKLYNFETSLSKFQTAAHTFHEINNILKTSDSFEEIKKLVYETVKNSRFEGKAVLADLFSSDELKKIYSINNLQDFISEKLKNLKTEITDHRTHIKQYAVTLENYRSIQAINEKDIKNLINDVKNNTLKLQNILNSINPALINNVI